VSGALDHITQRMMRIKRFVIRKDRISRFTPSRSDSIRGLSA